MAITVTTTTVDDITVYKFEANNTVYELITRDGIAFDVWSKRKNCGFGSQLNCYSSLKELAARSKALANFVKLIEG